MSENGNSIFINGKRAYVASIGTGEGVVTLDYRIESTRLELAPPPETDKQAAFSINTRVTASFEMKMTTEQAESIFGVFTEPRLIAKITTPKGDLYAPVKSYADNTITLDIPDTEDEMWRQSEYWKAELEEQERRLNAIKGEGSDG